MTDSHQSGEASTPCATAESVPHSAGQASSNTETTGTPHVTGVDVTKGDGVWSPAPAVHPYPPPGGHMIVMDPVTNTPVSYIPQHHHAYVQQLPSSYQSPFPQGFAVAPPQSSYHGTPVTADGVSQATPYRIMYLPAKQGHKCCGCCCDVRRATIVVNAVSLSLGVLGLMALIAMLKYPAYDYNGQYEDAMQLNDDYFQDDYEFREYMSGVDTSGRSLRTSMLLSLFYVFFRMVAEVVGIYGAATYSQWMVGVGLAGYVVDALFALVRLQLDSVIMAGFFAYPHVVLINEMRKGIMTEQTYQFEKHSCCCV
jgi:hypothetical protein